MHIKDVGGMAMNQYIVRTDGLFGITWDKDTSADLQTLRRSYLDSQLTQIIHGLKALDGENLELDANRESWKMYSVLYEQVQHMLGRGQCDENLMKTAAELYLLCLERVSDSKRILRNETPNLPPPPKLPPKPPQKPPPPPPSTSAAGCYFWVALPGALPPPPPPPPPAKSAQNVVAPKTEPSVPTRGGARSKEPAQLNHQDELKARLALRRSGINGTDSSSLGSVFEPPVRTQESTPSVNMIGQGVFVSKYNNTLPSVDEEQDWGD
jgi:hypothetical protein